MAEELQSLLEKINRDGLARAEQERAAIIEAAQAKAKEIIKNANSEADAARRKAEIDAENLRKRAESAIQQAARDVILALRSELEARIGKVIGSAAAQAMTPELMAETVRELVKAFAVSPDAELTVMTAVKDTAKLEAALLAALKDSFKNTPKIFADKEIESGLKVNISGSDVFYDFTDAAVRELLCDFVGAKLAKLLKA